jgi:hypothetical protein
MESVLTVSEYSPRCLVVRGNTASATRDRKEELKKLGGKYNPRLASSDGGREPGWIFPTKDKDVIKAYVEQINNEFDRMPKNIVNTVTPEFRRRRNSVTSCKGEFPPLHPIDPTLFDKQCAGDIVYQKTKKRKVCSATTEQDSNITPKNSNSNSNFWFYYSLILTTTFLILHFFPTRTRIISPYFDPLSLDRSLSTSSTYTECVKNLPGYFWGNVTRVLNIF